MVTKVGIGRSLCETKCTGENFYQGLLLAILHILGRKTNWTVQSNPDSGDGYCDIQVETDNNIGLCIEIQYTHLGNLDSACRNAINQIEEKNTHNPLKAMACKPC